jgi:radical S-adenosyl methionine domain-containing protein 2
MIMKTPPSVNFHLLDSCNMKCRFCFATFLDLPRQSQNQERAIQIIRELAQAGFKKITFAGGEPTLWKGLPELLQLSKSLGMTTMVVTNGWNLMNPDYYDRVIPNLDWIILSCDSVNDQKNQASGRAVKGESISYDDYVKLCSKAKRDGLKLKVNTVVSRFNLDDDMSAFISEVKPARWKIFQALPVAGQNDRFNGQFEITKEEFQSYLDRHAHLRDILDLVPEDNEAMTGSYVMVAPNGCFFDNSKGRHTYSDPILKVGLTEALRQINFDFGKYYSRGGVWSW